jgi:NAD(P)-dependent dehydrogenase (short-subunit alcohol dehydrogenase family)
LDDLKQRYPASQLLILALDVSVNEQIDQAFKNLIDHFGRLDVVVNNAGYVHICHFSRLSFPLTNDSEI